MVSLLLATVLSAIAAPTFEVQTVDGQPVTGELRSLDAKQLGVELPSGRAEMATEKVVSISAKQNPAAARTEPKVWVDLIDGSHLAANEYTVKEGKARAVLAGGEILELPVREVAAVRFQTGAPAMATQWSNILAMKLHNDILVASKGESMDYHKGVIHAVTDQQVRFDLDGDILNVKRAKIYGLVYYHAEANAAEMPYAILDATGSRWTAKSVALSGKLEWTLAGGQTIRRDLDQIRQIDLSRGKIVYLSDLQPELAIYTPLFGVEKATAGRREFYRPRLDQNLESQPLRIGGKPFSKGLAMHSRTEMAYAMPGRFSRFEAVAGIDDGVRPRGNLRLVIRGDSKVLLETTIAGTDTPKPLSIDVSGVQRLTILADFGDDLDIADHLDLGNARLVK